MPILVVPGVTTSTPGAVSTATVGGRPVARWSWSAGGRVRDLSAGTAYLRRGGIVGHLAAPRSALESTPPTLDGGVWRGEKFQPRDIGLSLITVASTPQAWWDESRALVRDFHGEGILMVSHPDGGTRMLTARYVTGLESPEGGDPGAIPIGAFVVQLRAYDPWWYGPAVTRKFQLSTAAGWFSGPPFSINPTELLGSGSTVLNPGDVDAYPMWTVTGPCSSVSATAEDGSAWQVDIDLTAGEVITVDCDPRVPGNAKITSASGANLWGVATSDYPDLWPLPAGESTITVAMAGASTASRVDLAFNPRYRTA